MKKIKSRNLVISITCIVFSIIMGILSKDLVIGGIILATGLLCSYFAGIGKRITYILGLINYLLMGYVSFKNNLFGIFFFYIFLCSPLQIQGFISWKKKLDEDESVQVRKFTFKNSMSIILLCVIASVILGYILTLIPGQRLAWLDAFSNIINICGIVLMNLRFKESWWLWLINNVIDTIIWIITFINHGEGAFMMLLCAIGFLLLNIYGIIKWTKKSDIDINKTKD